VSSTWPSHRQVDRAGESWRDAWAECPEADWRELATSLPDQRTTIEQYRRMHRAPLTLVAANLRYYVVKHLGSEAPVVIGQRLKEFPSIVLKVRREPTMRLSQMQDVGGCRAVVLLQEAVYEIANDLSRQKRWQVVDVDDYVTRPQASGYRAVHLTVRKDRRLIEVQLRTTTQHHWAEMIEAADRSRAFGPGVDLKHAIGPTVVRDYYQEFASVLALSETSRGHSPELQDRLAGLAALGARLDEYVSQLQAENHGS
jgi:hypothetical protein